ncbi:hypothetical protein [Parahaliea aestuarii]|uniref:Uncharacterized protein n=1 Tax=Parahaliea aestuarii TaxID=1852021 RepID=A0A5C8ZKB2_9GAMM|nr:hypothetical protein [Parahaliea aestuarii]TXS88913.1 hypothetical protein FVW59_19380 [Parahaliea aestuarii]
MKLLKIEDYCGHFLAENGSYEPIDKISKEDLLRLVNASLGDEEVEFDEYDEASVKNHAHQVIYKSVVRKLISLRERRQEFTDEAARLYLEDYERYKVESTG